MKRSLFIGLLICMLMFVTAQSGNAEYSLVDNITYFQGFNALSLTDYSLRLPNNNKYKNFSQKAQEKLIDLASRYGDKENIDYKFQLNNTEKQLKVKDSTEEEKEELKEVSFTPIPDVKINANYDEEEKNLQTQINTNFNLNYKVNSRTLIRAGYGLSSLKGWNLDNRKLESISDSNQGSDDQQDTIDNGSSDNTESDNDSNNDSNNDQTSNDGEPLFNSELNQQSSVGISYQTSDNVTVSADYIHSKEFQGTEGNSTILGVEYTDEEGKLKAQYQINTSKEKKQTITGLELDLKDLATITASYKLLDPQYIKDKLNKESVWDFGLDISLSEVSTFSIGYQLIDNKITDEQFNDNLNNKESNINASFKINF